MLVMQRGSCLGFLSTCDLTPGAAPRSPWLSHQHNSQVTRGDSNGIWPVSQAGPPCLGRRPSNRLVLVFASKDTCSAICSKRVKRKMRGRPCRQRCTALTHLLGASALICKLAACIDPPASPHLFACVCRSQAGRISFISKSAFFTKHCDDWVKPIEIPSSQVKQALDWSILQQADWKTGH